MDTRCQCRAVELGGQRLRTIGYMQLVGRGPPGQTPSPDISRRLGECIVRLLQTGAAAQTTWSYCCPLRRCRVGYARRAYKHHTICAGEKQACAHNAKDACFSCLLIPGTADLWLSLARSHLREISLAGSTYTYTVHTPGTRRLWLFFSPSGAERSLRRACSRLECREHHRDVILLLCLELE